MRLQHKTREVSTDDFYPFCDPPLIFRVRAAPRRGWLDLGEVLEDMELQDVATALKLLSSVAVNVSDGENDSSLDTPEATEDFYNVIQEAMPEMAAEIICSLAHGLALNCIREKKVALQRLKELSRPSNNGKAEREPVSAS